jgi:hypothetical protein
VLDQGIDTSTAIGRMFFQILEAIAEFEHALMSERTMDGLAAARARGQKPIGPRQVAIAGRCTTKPAPTATPLHRRPNRRRVRRHPPHHLPPPRTPMIGEPRDADPKPAITTVPHIRPIFGEYYGDPGGGIVPPQVTKITVEDPPQ